MIRSNPVRSAALIVLLLGGAVEAIGAPSDVVETLQERIAELEQREAVHAQTIRELTARLDRLGAERSWLAEKRDQEVRALVQEVLADADTRASRLGGGGGTIVWDQGAAITSDDGRFRLKLNGQLQFRYVLSGRDDAPADDLRQGFESSRTRLGFSGHVIDPSWTFLVWFGWTADGSSLLLDAWMNRKLSDEWDVTIGQVKVPVWNEWLISETRQQMIERSLVNARFGPGYGQGVMLRYMTDVLCLRAAVTDGLRTRNTGWSTSPDVTAGSVPYPQANDIALTARLDLRFGGTWKQFHDFNGWPDEEPALQVGAAVHVQEGESGTPDDEADILQWTVDGSWVHGGANLYAAVIGLHYETAVEERDEIGLMLQAGLFLTDDWEAVARYEWGDLDGAGAHTDELSLLTVGLTRSWNRHALKWSTDLGYAFRPVDPGWASTGAGWRADRAGEDGQIVLRSQVQLLF